MTELDLIIDLHRHNERQGPGSAEVTIRALSFMDLPTQHPLRIADIGCGTGSPTVTLAQHTGGHITAVDLFPEFLAALQARSERLGLAERISTLECSMDALPFGQETFDLIWSEGAIYNMGFEAGVKQWKDYLRAGGYLAVSEITWISPSRPQAIADFWMREYPEIDIASRKINILEDNGFTLAGYFYLAEDNWMEHYYQPLEAGFPAFLERHGHSELAQKVVKDCREEIASYQAYKAYYSYGFYVARKAKI